MVLRAMPGSSASEWGSRLCSSPSTAPGTGTPEIAGFSTAEAVTYLRALRGIRLVGCDVVEVSPPYDGAGQQTALAGANVLWELLALRALRP